MKIILTKDVPNLGSLGDTVNVKPGYARNYLIPQKFALLASSRKSRELQHHLNHLEKSRKGEVSAAQEKARRIRELSLSVTRKSGTSGRLFGSVTSRDILELLAENGFEFERRSVTISSPIRTVGTHSFTLNVHTEVKLDLEITVISESVPQNTVKEETRELTEEELVAEQLRREEQEFEEGELFS